MKRYVLGFLFDEEGEWVVLIRKNKPEWQKGLLNGVGGKIEPGETALAAMIREYAEEAGVVTRFADWREFCLMDGPDCRCHCFTGRDSQTYVRSVSSTDEQIVLVKVSELKKSMCISNVPWLVQLALDENPGGGSLRVVARYGSSEQIPGPSNPPRGEASMRHIKLWPFPDVKPPEKGHYLAGHGSVCELYWNGVDWKVKDRPESRLTERVKWWGYSDVVVEFEVEDETEIVLPGEDMQIHLEKQDRK